MRISRSRCLILSFILMCRLVPEVTTDAEEASGKKKKKYKPKKARGWRGVDSLVAMGKRVMRRDGIMKILWVF